MKGSIVIVNEAGLFDTGIGSPARRTLVIVAMILLDSRSRVMPGIFLEPAHAAYPGIVDGDLKCTDRNIWLQCTGFVARGLITYDWSGYTTSGRVYMEVYKSGVRTWEDSRIFTGTNGSIPNVLFDNCGPGSWSLRMKATKGSSTTGWRTVDTLTTH